MTSVIPFSLKDEPALIEKIFPVQKLSAESYKEQMANVGKTLTALGSYWKGRKPLILNKAVILGCLLPATQDLARDLEIFEMLMAMDDESFVVRWKRRPQPKEILEKLSIAAIDDYFMVEPSETLPNSSPIDWSKPEYKKVKITWRDDIPELKRRRLEARLLPKTSYRERVGEAQRPEEVIETVHAHIWDAVNAHLGTDAHSYPELLEQLGVMRFGRRPQLADTFCGSGQIPFEAARLGCDVYASDLNPVACMLTWGALNIVGGSPEARAELTQAQKELVRKVQAEIDALRVEDDGNGWRGKAYLYCVEVICPQTGWRVPLLPSRIISKGYRVVAELKPDTVHQRYFVTLRTGVIGDELVNASKTGSVRTDGRGGDPYLIHTVAGVEYRTKISTLRGDNATSGSDSMNRLRLWEESDFIPRPDDVYQERLYAIQWMRTKKKGKGEEYEFRAVTEDDMERERKVQTFIATHLVEWQANGWIPDMRIETGYNTRQPIWERGWTHWHHLFNPRQLLVAGLVNKYAQSAALKVCVSQVINWSSKLSPWNPAPGGDSVNNTFYNQALNTLFAWGTRSSRYVENQIAPVYKSFPFSDISISTNCHPVVALNATNDLYVTDPPYGDAVKYEEILEFFIAWLRKNPPPEFAGWVWDSRRALAIKGEDEDFRQGMISAYTAMAQHMPANGIQVIMFTHQSGSIWGDMTNIVWAAGLQVTAAWYVVTETDSALREGSYVKGTVMLVLRKRQGTLKATRDDLAWEIKDEVETQVQALTGLNQSARGAARDENLFEDADLQMAGYAAALRVLTRYAIINGRDMAAEAARPRVKGQPTLVDELIEFAVSVANQSLVPLGIAKAHWDRLQATERFYLKMIELEARGQKTLDNYQNFAKAFKVENSKPWMASEKANAARLKSAVELSRSEMNDTALRALLYAMMELVKEKDGDEVLAHLALNIHDYYDQAQRELLVELAGYLAKKLEGLRPEEARAARVLGELILNQRL